MGTSCESFDCSGLSDCNKKGICTAPNTCKCLQGYIGSDCGQFDCTQKANCSSNGNCTAPDVCSCFTGYLGNTCADLDCSVRSCSNRSVGIGVGVGLGLLFLILLVLLLLFLFFKKKKSDNPSIKKPNFQSVIFPGNYVKLFDTSAQENNLRFLKTELVKHLGLVNLMTPCIAKKEYLDNIPKALAHIFQNEPLTVDLFENWVTLELVAAKSKGTLFRLNSCSTNFFSAYIKLNCLHYMWWVNSILLHELYQKSREDDNSNSISGKMKLNENKDFDEEAIPMDVATTELNPKELGDVDELYVKANTYQLLLYLTQLERRIVTSSQVMPSDLKRFFFPS